MYKIEHMVVFDADWKFYLSQTNSINLFQASDCRNKNLPTSFIVIYDLKFMVIYSYFKLNTC